MGPTDKQARQASFWKKYLRLTRVGVPALRAVELASEEEKDPAFRKILNAIRQNLEKGERLSEILQEFSREFSASTVELIKTAERRGTWEEVLEELVAGLLDGTFA